MCPSTTDSISWSTVSAKFKVALRKYLNTHSFYFVDEFLICRDYLYLLTYLLTYCMVQSPSWEGNWFAASQEIPRISRNPKVHYCTHSRPPPVSILGQPSPVHIHISHLLEIHRNIIHSSTPSSPQWSLSLRFPHQDPIQPPLLTHTCHIDYCFINCLWGFTL